MIKEQKTVLFVGSFITSGNDGSVGGQMYACKQILENQKAKTIKWVLIDSTSKTIINRNFFNRFGPSAIRLYLFIYHLIFSKIDACLIFTSDGLSFYEKGTMAILGKIFFKKVIIAPRSGFIKRDIEQSRLSKYFVLTVFKISDKVLCQGKLWKDYLKKHLSIVSNKYLVLNNWIDTSKFSSEIQFVKGEKQYILYLAWVSKEKGIFDLIEAARLITINFPKVVFLIGGEGKELEIAKQMVSDYELNKNFEFLGWIVGEEKIHYLKVAQIFVLPSYAEGFPNSLIEAALYDNAIVASNVGSISDLIEHKQNGFLFQSGNVDDIVEYVTQLLSNEPLRHTFVIETKKKVIENHSSNLIIPKLIDTLVNI